MTRNVCVCVSVVVACLFGRLDGRLVILFMQINSRFPQRNERKFHSPQNHARARNKRCQTGPKIICVAKIEHTSNVPGLVSWTRFLQCSIRTNWQTFSPYTMLIKTGWESWLDGAVFGSFPWRIYWRERAAER